MDEREPGRGFSVEHGSINHADPLGKHLKSQWSTIDENEWVSSVGPFLCGGEQTRPEAPESAPENVVAVLWLSPITHAEQEQVLILIPVIKFILQLLGRRPSLKQQTRLLLFRDNKWMWRMNHKSCDILLQWHFWARKGLNLNCPGIPHPEGHSDLSFGMAFQGWWPTGFYSILFKLTLVLCNVLPLFSYLICETINPSLFITLTSFFSKDDNYLTVYLHNTNTVQIHSI